MHVFSPMKSIRSSLLLRVVLAGVPTALHAQADIRATAETHALFENLRTIGQHGFIFGAQNTTSVGRGWTSNAAKPLKSDVQKSTGDFPGVFGFDFNKWDFDRSRNWMLDLDQVKEIYRRGGIVTFSWHMNNPITGKSSKDKTGRALKEILPGGKRNALFNSWLDKVALFADAARVDGKAIPIIFRPFHENTGDWFWWGSQNAPEDFIAAFRYVVTYLREEKYVHSFLYAYSPAKPTSVEHYLATYPGDAFVDILGFDCYMTETRPESLKPYVAIVSGLAQEKRKIAAITETGCRKGVQNSSDTQWFTNNLLTPLREMPPEAGIAYCLTWQNQDSGYWVPLPGDPTHADFLKFYHDPLTLFLSDLPNLYRSQSASTPSPSLH